MISEICFPELLSGQELDAYLNRGWFRMGQSIFTTDYTKISDQYLPVYWLRIDLDNITYGRSQKKIISANRNFTTEIKPFMLSHELDDLYFRYAAHVEFDAPVSVEEFLFFGAMYNVYDSYLVEVREGKKLIAAGIFDQGACCISGIMNFYDPDYRSKSPGKFLMLQKIAHGRASGKKWYYLGYVAGGTTKFDYKLFPDRHATQLYDRSNDRWVPYVDEGQSLITSTYEGLIIE